MHNCTILSKYSKHYKNEKNFQVLILPFEGSGSNSYSNPGKRNRRPCNEKEGGVSSVAKKYVLTRQGRHVFIVLIFQTWELILSQLREQLSLLVVQTGRPCCCPTPPCCWSTPAGSSWTPCKSKQDLKDDKIILTSLLAGLENQGSGGRSRQRTASTVLLTSTSLRMG